MEGPDSGAGQEEHCRGKEGMVGDSRNKTKGLDMKHSFKGAKVPAAGVVCEGSPRGHASCVLQRKSLSDSELTE
jgi:hypothetical protein